MTGMKFLRELTEDVTFITEETKDGKKNLYIEGVFMVAGTQNKNRRIYPNNVMEKEVERYTKELVMDRRAYGELGHPNGPKINEDRISHLITELRIDGNNVLGKAIMFDTVQGLNAQKIMERGGKLGVSSRGLGSLKETKDGVMEVQNDFHLATAGDIVVDPSAPGAFVSSIMEETDWYYDNATGTYAQVKIEKIKESIKKMTVKQITEEQTRLFKSFLDSLVRKRQ